MELNVQEYINAIKKQREAAMDHVVELGCIVETLKKEIEELKAKLPKQKKSKEKE